ncbi:hypothetical protein AC579_936 [Pseudocercospora musae]|uniref:Uncharacterized protein n=1 Tax=Pseudocercospora musae TaxID=113226 RepID=A0A139IUA7_9PEZI|nr:hypothetical protein AC579_936 [Pseudocercospora musae]KXT18336.1 hypothetical protein AC579_936 [Pseudocercospora musae]KXT18337.1 hypothetical protein AC579_936 [Pseudocercospora musae]KXT18340.1 hypothetical protein AC579_936 [Pseudocercospora musae]
MQIGNSRGHLGIRKLRYRGEAKSTQHPKGRHRRFYVLQELLYSGLEGTEHLPSINDSDLAKIISSNVQDGIDWANASKGRNGGMAGRNHPPWT